MNKAIDYLRFSIVSTIMWLDREKPDGTDGIMDQNHSCGRKAPGRVKWHDPHINLTWPHHPIEMDREDLNDGCPPEMPEYNN